MTTIVQTNGVTAASGAVSLTSTTLTSADTLTYQNGSSQRITFTNTTASPVTVTLVGTAPTPVTPVGYGGTVSTSGGKAIAVPASGVAHLKLDNISAFLSGTGSVAVTGGTGLTAVLYI